jgi:hypothetical protein
MHRGFLVPTVAVGLLLLLTACRRERRTADVIPIDDVRIESVRPGGRIEVAGAGFVPGPVDVDLEGRVREPGIDPIPWTFTVPATAVSETEIVGLFPADAVDVLHATHGRFEGSVMVRFAPPAALDLPGLTGRRTGVSLPMISESPALHDHRLRLERDAKAFLERLGIEVAQAPGPGAAAIPGVTVTAVSPGAEPPADELRPGDRIVAVDDVAVGSPADLAPAPSASVVRLTVEERDDGTRFPLYVSSADDVDPVPLEEALALLLALALVAILGGLHFSGLGDRLGRWMVFPLLRARPSPPARTSARTEPGIAGRITGTVLLGLAVGASLAAPILVATTGSPLRVVDAWAVTAALLVLHRVFHAAGDLASRPARPLEWLTRSAGAVLSAAATLLPLTVVVAATLWSSAALTLGGAMDAQGPNPIGWAALRDPFLALAAVLALTSTGAGFDPAESRLRLALDTAAAAAVALLLAVVGFGGSNAGPLTHTRFAGLPVGAWTLIGKAALLLAAVFWYERRRRARGLPSRRTGPGALAALPLAAASIAVAGFVPEAWTGLLRPLTLAALAAVALGLWLRHRQRTAPAILEIRVGET